MMPQRGGFVLGLVAGLLIGLALALGVALYITKAPIPFLNKVPQRTAEQDSAEAERNRNWDPNAPLSGAKPGARSAASGAVAGASAAAQAAEAASVVARSGVAPGGAASSPGSRASGKDPAAILSGAAADPFVYFVQAGAFTRSEDAEQQRARLALLGQAAKVTEREQAGRTVYRVRLGPFDTREEADGLQLKLQEQTVETQIVRVERP
jgi:cell division protein FtsN